MSTICKTFKYKLEPTLTQARQLTWMLARCRELYNAAVQERRDAWQMRRVSVSYYDQKAELPSVKEVRPEYKDIHSQVLQDVILRVERTFRRFFDGLKSGMKVGYPRFQGANRYHSLTYPQFENGARLDNGFLILSKIGRVKVRWSRPVEGTIKTATISQEADGWYVCLSCADVTCEPLPIAHQETGIDVGLKAFLTTSQGLAVANPRWLRKMERKLKWHQRRVSRRKTGSTRRKKAVKELAKCHQMVRRQRRDFHFKTANQLIQQNDAIYHETLQVRNLVKNRHLAKSISDAGWSQFLSILSFKAACAGRTVIAVPPAYTSQDWRGCGERVPKSLSVRTHICPECGLVMDRDENAARNIQRAGQALRGYPAVAG
jgi:putative transposase